MSNIAWTAVTAAVLAVLAVLTGVVSLFVDVDGLLAVSKVCVGASITFAVLSLREGR